MSKLVLLGYDYPPNDGGISRLSASLVEGLARAGQAVQVLTLCGDGRAGPERPPLKALQAWHRKRRRRPVLRAPEAATPRARQGVPVTARLGLPRAFAVPELPSAPRRAMTVSAEPPGFCATSRPSALRA